MSNSASLVINLSLKLISVHGNDDLGCQCNAGSRISPGLWGSLKRLEKDLWGGRDQWAEHRTMAGTANQYIMGEGWGDTWFIFGWEDLCHLCDWERVQVEVKSRGGWVLIVNQVVDWWKSVTLLSIMFFKGASCIYCVFLSTKLTLAGLQEESPQVRKKILRMLVIMSNEEVQDHQTQSLPRGTNECRRTIKAYSFTEHPVHTPSCCPYVFTCITRTLLALVCGG